MKLCVYYQLLAWRWYIPSIPLEAGHGTSAQTCGLNDMFPPDDFVSGPYAPFIIYIPYIIATILVIKKALFWETCLPNVGVAILVYWMIWYCYYSFLVSNVHFSRIVLTFYISKDGYRYHVILCIGHLHPFKIYRTGFWVCVVLVLSVIMCSFYYFLDKILFHHIMIIVTIIGIFMAITYFLATRLGFL